MNSSRVSQLNDSLASARTPDEVALVLSLIDAEEEGQQVARGDPFRVFTLAEVADFFGVTEQAAKQWHGGPNGMPGIAGAYNLRKIAQWLIAKRNYRNMPADESNRHAMREKIKVETERKRLDLDLKRGKLVEREAVAAVNEEIFSVVRARLEALAGEIATSVPVDVRSIVMEECSAKVRAALMELAKYGVERANSESAVGDAEGVDSEGTDSLSDLGAGTDGQ